MTVASMNIFVSTKGVLSLGTSIAFELPARFHIWFLSDLAICPEELDVSWRVF